jgi:hypothetical protein
VLKAGLIFHHIYSVSFSIKVTIALRREIKIYKKSLLENLKRIEHFGKNINGRVN